MIAITVDFKEVDNLVKQIAATLEGSQLAEVNAVAGRAASNAAMLYSRDFDQSGKWKGSGGLASSGSSFGSEITAGWFFKASDSNSATISNGAPLYAQKVFGGTITPKRARALTIPLVQDAKGRRAADYEIFFGRRLFTIPGRNVLFEQTGKDASESALNRLYGKRRSGDKVQVPSRGGLRAVYALVASVTQGPWPGALPPDDVITGAFADGWQSELAKIIDKL